MESFHEMPNQHCGDAWNCFNENFLDMKRILLMYDEFAAADVHWTFIYTLWFHVFQLFWWLHVDTGQAVKPGEAQ